MKDATSKSNPDLATDAASQAFPKAERLCSKRIFTEIFEQGSSFRMGVLKFFYVWDVPPDWQEVPLQLGVSAPKRAFKRAVLRNRLRRRMREAYRINKQLIVPDLTTSGHRLSLFIKIQARHEVDFHRINRAMYKGLKRLKEELRNIPNAE